MHVLHRRPGGLALAIVTVLIISLTASSSEAQKRPDEIDISYLWDGGAVPFTWRAVAGRTVLESTLDSPERPLLFSTSDGGMPSKKSQELPGPVVTAAAGLLSLAVALDDDESRWFHLKGMAQSFA